MVEPLATLSVDWPVHKTFSRKAELLYRVIKWPFWQRNGGARSSINGFPNTSVLKKFDSYSQIFWMLFGRLEAIDSVGIDLWVMIDIEGLRSTYGVSATFRQQVWAVLEWLEDFKKTRFADFLWERTRRFFTYTLAPFLSNITSNMETCTIQIWQIRKICYEKNQIHFLCLICICVVLYEWTYVCRWFRFAQLAKGKKSRP
jgi:hypothetical protein